MKGEARKAAVAAYKERTVAAGIYAVRCSATGETWVGKAPDLSTIENRLWFTLGQGGNPHRDLQAAYRQHGAAAFSFEVVERLRDEDIKFGRDDVLRKRRAHWADKLGAASL